MTLKQAKDEIKRLIEDIKIECRNGSLFHTGETFGYQHVLKMLDHLEPSWHEYPAEKPPKDGEYIVTVPFEGVEHVAYAEFEQGRWLLPSFCYNCLGYVDTPIAWAELPKPYKKEEEK